MALTGNLAVFLIKSGEFFRGALINSTHEMKHEARGTQQSGHINKIGEEASAAQQSDPLA